MVIDHIGIVVRSLSEGIEQWARLFGYAQSSKVVTNIRQKVNVVFLEKPNSITIKLIEPCEQDSPIYLFARRGGGLHHLCFKCDDVNSGLQHMQNEGARLIAPPQPGEAFKNNKIAFFMAGSLNVELIDTPEKEGLLPEERTVGRPHCCEVGQGLVEGKKLL